MYLQKKTGQELYLKIPVPSLDHPSEEAVFESNQFKEQHETVKLLNEELYSKTLKILIMNWIEQCMSEKLLIPEESWKFGPYIAQNVDQKMSAL